MKVRPFNKHLLKEYGAWMSVAFAFYSFISFFITIHEHVFKFANSLCGQENLQIYIVIFLYALLPIGIFCYLWYKANKIQSIKIVINGTRVIVKFGDLFKEAGLKTITFNEFFDTQVDDIIISSKTINGIFLNNQKESMPKIEEVIDCDENENIIDVESNKKQGKKKRYKLGSTKKYEDYLLVAFSKFNDKNMAYLNLEDYFACLMKYWSEVNRLYNGNNVVLPLIGSGVTRFQNSINIKPQDLIEIILNCFKYSNLPFSHDFIITLILHESINQKINLYNIKEKYNGI